MTDKITDVKSESRDPVGIGGWLIIPIIGFFGTILLTGWSLAQVFFELDAVKSIIAGTNEVLVALRVPVGLSVVGAVAVIVSAVLCLYLIFAKRRAIVPIAIAHYVILAAASLMDLWADIRITELVPNTPRDPSTTTGAVRGVVALAIWGTYFAVSKRVRNTFVEPKTFVPEPRPNASTDLGL